MRTTIDIPDQLMEQVRQRLQSDGRSLRDVVIDGLRRSLVVATPAQFQLPEAAFSGRRGFCSGFSADQLTAAIHDDAAERGLSST